MVQISYLPPILNKEEEEKPKEYIVPTTLLAQGNTEYEINKARNLTNMSATMEQNNILKPKNQREAMYNIGTELQDNNIAKDEAWWKKALGWLEPFKYLDVPIEMAAEAVFDPLAMATGRDLSWVRGTAEREPFEAWRAMFGDDVSEKTGMGEFMARMDIAAEAFEKRPFVAQLGLMGVQMAASFGAAGYARAAAAGAKWGGTLGGRTARTGAMILDPWEVGFHGLKYGFRGAKAGVSLLKGGEEVESVIIKRLQDPAVAAIMGATVDTASRFDVMADRLRRGEAVVQGGSGDPLERMINSPVARLNARAANELAEEFGWSGPTYRPRYSMRGDGIKGSVSKEGDFVGPAVNRTGDTDSIPLVLERDNKFQQFMHDKWTSAQEAPSGSWERIRHLQQLAAVQLTLSLGSRPGHVFKASFRDLIADSNSFLNTNRLKHYDKQGRSTLMFPLDMGEAHTAVRALAREMEEYGRINNLGDRLTDWAKKEDKSDPELFNFKAKPDGTFSFEGKADSLTDMLRGLRDEGWVDLPESAEQIRQHTATVLALQGIPFEHIKTLLNHSDVGTTRIYIREMPYIGFKSDNLIQGGTGRFDSNTYKQVSLAARIKNAVKSVSDKKGKTVDESGELIEDSEYYTSLTERVSKFSELVKKVKDAPRAKGADIAKGEYEDIVAEFTDIVMYDSALDDIVDEYIPNWARSLADGDDVIGAGAESVRVANEMARLIGVFNMVTEIERGAKFADNVKRATNHNYNPKGRTRSQFYADRALGRPNTKFDKPGLLNRAGYFIQDGEYQWAGNIEGKNALETKTIRDYWTAERNKLAKQANLNWNDEFVDTWVGSRVKATDKQVLNKQMDRDWSGFNANNLVDVGENIAISGKAVKWRGRNIIMVRLPNGRLQPFYRRTGEGGGVAGDGAAAGGYAPIDGIVKLPNGSLWMDKHSYTVRDGREIPIDDPLFRFGDEELKRVGRYLDRLEEIPEGKTIAKDKYADVNRFLTGLDPESAVVNTPKPEQNRLWSSWVTDNFTNAKNGDEIQEMNTIRAEGFEEGRKTLDVSDVLRHGLELKQWELFHEWNQLRGLADGDATNVISGDLDSIFSMLMGLSGEGGIRGAQKNPNWVYARINELKKIHRVVPQLDKSWLDDAGRLKTNKVLRVPVDSDIEKWLDTDDVTTAFQIHKITPTNSQAEIVAGLHRLASTGSHRIFGDNFALFSKNHPNEANEWIEDLGKKIAWGFREKESWGVKLQANIEHDYTEFLERINAYRQQRPQIKGSEGILKNGVTSIMAIGGVARIQDVAENITSLTNVFGKNFNEWYNGGSALATVIRRSPLPMVYSAFTGGTAGLARPVTKAISARARQYLKAERVGMHAGAQFEAVSQDLGLDRMVPSVQQEELGVIGHEFFSKLKVRDLTEIQKWEDTTGNIKYRKFATKDRKKAATLSRLKSTLRQRDTYAPVGEGLTADYLKQVDIVLERIHPEDWHIYFDDIYLTKPGTGINNIPREYVRDAFGDLVWTKTGKDLLYLKDMMHQMDRIAGERGVKIVETVRSKGGHYLSNYFPRMYKMRNKNRLEERASRNYLLNSQAQFFEARDESLEDIIDVLGYGRDGKEMGKYNLEDVSKRAGAYIESMYKEVADHETVEWIKSTQDFKVMEELRTKLDGDHGAARDLETLINQRLPRDITGSLVEGALPEELTELIELPDVDILRKVTAAFASDPEAAKYIELLNDRSAKATEALVGLQSQILRFATKKQKDTTAVISDINKHALGDVKGLDNIINAVRVLSPRDQQAIKQHLVVSNNFFGNFLKWPAFVMQRPTEALRYFKSGVDMGAPMIHGFNSLVRAPLGREGLDASSTKTWFKGVKHMFKFAFDPDQYDKYIVDNLQLMNEAGEYVRLGTPEPLQITDTSATMKKVREWASKQKWNPARESRFLQRFETGFTGYLDVMRTELWKGMKGSVDSDLNRAAKNLDSAAFERLKSKKYHELGAIINKMTGAFDPEMAQQTPFQRLIENSLLFFAPMYRRATFGVMADAFRGGKRSEEALRQMSGIIVAGGMMASLAEMTGNNTRAFLFDQEGELGEKGALDITARFGKFNIGGMQTGIGTAWWTIFRTASDVAMHMYHGEDEMDLDKDHWANHWATTMLGRRGRSQLAPGSSLALDIFSGSTFIGEPLRDADENNYAAMGKHIARSTVPFWLDGIFAGGASGALIAMPAEFLGLSSYEISSYDKLTKARQEAINSWDDSNFGDKSIQNWRVSQERQGKNANYINMPYLLKRHLDEQNPQVKALKHEHDILYGTSTYGDAETMLDYRRFKAQIDKEALMTLARLSKSVEAGTADYGQLQDAISNVKYAKRVSNQAKMTENPELAARFGLLRDANANSEVIFMGDIYYDSWQELRNDPAYKDEDGTFNYKKMHEAEAEFWADPNMLQYKDYIIERSRQWNEHLPVVREFEEAKDYLRSQKYWDIEDLVWTPGSQQHNDAAEYLKLPSRYRDAMRANDPYYQQIQREVERKRNEMVSQNQELDRILVTYYGNNPRHPLNTGLKERLMQENARRPSRTPDPTGFTVSETGRIQISPIELQ